MALVGAATGAGTTTATLCLAQQAKARESYWTLLDADFAHATLARQVGIAQTGRLASGPGRAGQTGGGLDRFARRSSDSGAAGRRAGGRAHLATNFRAPSLFTSLAEAGELLLVDGGAAVGPSWTAGGAGPRSALDAIYLVFDGARLRPGNWPRVPAD